MRSKVSNVDVFTIICFGVALRAIVSLHSYSGAQKPPLHGDYEAQRHWQEITLNLEPIEWYRNSTDNDLLYWGIDYPPLTSYHSWAMAMVARNINESYVELGKSRGFESSEHKSFMRLTVLLCDLIVYIPSVLVLASALQKTFSLDTAVPIVALMMLYPGQILIDNGHFQYNNVSLGLAALAIAAILRKRVYAAAFCFSLALNYKQMELYHALPFFAYLLRVCFTQPSFLQGMRKLFTIGAIVVATFAVLWLPWLGSMDAASSVLTRLFPFNRGVFEDKVANLWCAVNLVYKLKDKLTIDQTALLCLATTALAVFPLNGHLFYRKGRLPFVLTLVNTSLAFFLFSYQVHEKSILLAALPAFCLFVVKPTEIFWFLEISVVSIFPLLAKDGLGLAFFGLSLIFHLIMKTLYLNQRPAERRAKVIARLCSLSTLLSLGLVVVSLLVPAPERYPFLWPLLISLFSFGGFLLFFVLSVFWQLTL